MREVYYQEIVRNAQTVRDRSNLAIEICGRQARDPLDQNQNMLTLVVVSVYA
jgi:hypothetical protein